MKGRGGRKKFFSQINFNLRVNEKPTFCGFKKCSTTCKLNSDLFLQFLKLGPKRAKIGKYTGISLENGQKTSKKLIIFLFLLRSF